jgi:hypothetical protein
VSGARDPTFAQRADVRSYGLGVSQVLTRNMILGLNFEVITDEGYLNSPYRQVRFLDSTVPAGVTFASEIYPATHTSNAFSARLKYFLSYRAALEGNYRFFSDTWGIQANSVEVGYTHPLGPWTLEGKVRYYRQEAADFYSDLFPRANFANFLARDKELSTFQSYGVGIGAAYDFKVARLPWIQKSTVNVRYNHLFIDYDNFRDATRTDVANGILPGQEPLYQLNANVIQAFISIWF